MASSLRPPSAAFPNDEYVTGNSDPRTLGAVRRHVKIISFHYDEEIFDDLDIHKAKRKPTSRFTRQQLIQDIAMADLEFDTYYEGVHTLHPYHGMIEGIPMDDYQQNEDSSEDGAEVQDQHGQVQNVNNNEPQLIQDFAMANLEFDTYYDGVHRLHSYHGNFATIPLHSF